MEVDSKSFVQHLTEFDAYKCVRLLSITTGALIRATSFITCIEPLLCQTLLHLFESPLSSLNYTSSAFEFVQHKLSALVLKAILSACSPELNR